MNFNRPKALVFSEIVAALVLLASLLSFLTPSLPAGVLSVAFFALWLMWILCVFWKGVRVFEVLRLWLVIDVAILFMFLSMSASLGDILNLRDVEAVIGTAYLPMVFPAYYVITLVPTEALHEFDTLMRGAYLSAIGAWIQLSLLAVIQGVCYYYLGRLFVNFTNRWPQPKFTVAGK